MMKNKANLSIWQAEWIFFPAISIPQYMVDGWCMDVHKRSIVVCKKGVHSGPSSYYLQSASSHSSSQPQSSSWCTIGIDNMMGWSGSHIMIVSASNRSKPRCKYKPDGARSLLVASAAARIIAKDQSYWSSGFLV
jgi:hypothetical protein